MRKWFCINFVCFMNQVKKKISVRKSNENKKVKKYLKNFNSSSHHLLCSLSSFTSPSSIFSFFPIFSFQSLKKTNPLTNSFYFLFSPNFILNYQQKTNPLPQISHFYFSLFVIIFFFTTKICVFFYSIVRVLANPFWNLKIRICPHIHPDMILILVQPPFVPTISCFNLFFI